MKTILLLSMLFFSCSASFSQPTEKKIINVTKSLNLKKFLDSRAKQKPSILLKPLTVKEYPQQITLSDSLRKGLTLINNHIVFTNSMPVWSPGSDYVFNMPGTFAYDKTQVKIHTPRFVTVVNRNKEASSDKIVPANKE